MTAAVFIPESPDEITPAWLTQTLRAGGHLGEATVTAVAHEIVGQGIGFVGLLARLSLTYDRNEPGAPASLIGKFPSPNEGARQVAILYGVYEREVRFYQDLAPEAGLDTPRAYAALMDPAAGRYLILLEDLRDGRFGDQVVGCTVEEARMVVRELARFHAAWWHSPRLGEHVWLQRSVDVVRAAIVMAYSAIWPAFHARFGERLSPELAAAGPALGEKLLPLIDEYAARPDTLGHGDFRVDNIFFGAEGHGRPLTVLDWQGCLRVWSGAYDLIYFLAGGLTLDDRRAHEQELIATYHAALVQAGVTDYSLDELTHDCRVSLLFAFVVIGVIAGGALDMVNERAVELFTSMFDRFLPAMEDHRVLELLPG